MKYAWLLAAFVFVVHCRGTMGCADSMWSVPTAVSLWDHGDPNLDEYLPVVHARHDLFVERHGGHTYTMFPIGTSLLVAPAVPVLRWLARMTIGDDRGRFLAYEAWQMRTGCPTVAAEPIVSLHSISELILASAIVAVTAAVICAIGLAEGLPVGAAVSLGAIFAFGTSAWSTASRSLWQHGPSMLVLSLALLLQVRRRLLPVAGALLAFAYVIRPTNAVALAAASLWCVAAFRRRAIGFAAGAAGVLLAFAIANERMFGAALPPYFQPQRIAYGATFWEALAANIVSPARGLLVFSPVLAFAGFGVALKLRRRTFSTLDASLLAAVGLHWIAIASFAHWWGGYSYGPRFFTDMLPYLAFFLIPVLAWLHERARPSRIAPRALFAAAVVFSVFAHAEGALAPNAVMWNAIPVSVDAHPERIWDWRDPQVLAGVRER